MKTVRVLCAALLTAALATGALAHELVLKPAQDEVKKGDKLQVAIHSGHKFIVPEEVEDADQIKAGLFKDGKLQEAKLTPNEKGLCIDFEVDVEDDSQSLVLVANKNGGVWSITNEGGKSGTRKDLEGQGLKVKTATKNDKCVKAVINAKPGDKNFGTVTGQPLELIPVTNPADVKVGGVMDVKILLNGQPYTGPVWASWDGFAPDYENTYAYYTEAENGLAHIKITAPGLWGVRAMQKGLPGVEGEYDSLTVRSFLMFNVK